MKLEIHIEAYEPVNNLTFASAIIDACSLPSNQLDAVKVAKEILVEMGCEGEGKN